MFQTLLESGDHGGDRRVGWTLASALTHATIIAFAVALTLPTARSEATPVAATPVLYVAPRAIPNTRPPSSQSRHTSAIERIIHEVPTIVAPVLPSTDPQTISEQWFAWLDSSRNATARHSGQSGDGVFAAGSVDRIVASLGGNRQPEYPALLRHAAVEGDVRVRFVVDSAGRVEEKSIEIVEATHPLFGSAVRQWLLRNRYLPAEVSGRRVRQLVAQRIQFTLQQQR